MSKMLESDHISRIYSELQEGISLAKCRKCGCMKETLENLEATLSTNLDAPNLLGSTRDWLKQMEPIQYPCIGCSHCFPAVATNLINQVFPASQAQSSDCAFEVRENTLFPVAGEYFAFCHGEDCPVAVSTLASTELAEQLANIKPNELCIVGKTETENIGVDKIIKNIVSNPTIRFLLLTGQESQGHYSGKTLLALAENGVDQRMRVIGSPGKRPVLKNITQEEVKAFRNQVRVIDLVGCEDIARIIEKIEALAQEQRSSCNCAKQTEEIKSLQISTVQVIQAEESGKIRMDKAGYFVILPQLGKETIMVEHYSYSNILLGVIEGKNARSLYWTIIENGWVTQLDHAAYLGEELTKAELSIQLRFKYVQDKPYSNNVSNNHS